MHVYHRYVITIGLVVVSCYNSIIFTFLVSSIMVDSIKVMCDIEYVVYIGYLLDLLLLLLLLYKHSKAEHSKLKTRFLHGGPER